MGVQRSSGWRFPWAVRVRVADLLLRSLFESDDSGAYVEDRTALLSLLENQLWPLLGISPQVWHDSFTENLLRHLLLLPCCTLLAGSIGSLGDICDPASGTGSCVT